MSIDEVKFRKPVEPGVLLRLDVEIVQKKRPRHQVRGTCDWSTASSPPKREFMAMITGSAQEPDIPQVALTGRLC